MRRLMFLFVLCLFAPLAAAQGSDTLLHDVLTDLAKHAAVRAEFSQTRSNPALDKPQVSEGRLLFVLGHGMLWQTTTPYAETLALTGNRTSRIDADGRSQAMRSERGVSQVSQMLQGLLSGKLDEALRQFSVTANGTPGQWTLEFVPKQERMARVLGSITLSGNDVFHNGTLIGRLDGVENGRNGQPLRINLNAAASVESVTEGKRMSRPMVLSTVKSPRGSGTRARYCRPSSRTSLPGVDGLRRCSTVAMTPAM